MGQGPSAAIRANCPIATSSNDGLMSQAQAARLASLTPGGSGNAFFYTIQGGDADDFTVPIPAQIVLANASYVVAITLASNVPSTGMKVPQADQTTTTLRVITEAVYDVGVVLGITITPVT